MSLNGHQTRRSISVNGVVYEQSQRLASLEDRSVSEIVVELLVARCAAAGIEPLDIKEVEIRRRAAASATRAASEEASFFPVAISTPTTGTKPKTQDKPRPARASRAKSKQEVKSFDVQPEIRPEPEMPEEPEPDPDPRELEVMQSRQPTTKPRPTSRGEAMPTVQDSPPEGGPRGGGVTSF